MLGRAQAEEVGIHDLAVAVSIRDRPSLAEPLAHFFGGGGAIVDVRNVGDRMPAAQGGEEVLDPTALLHPKRCAAGSLWSKVEGEQHFLNLVSPLPELVRQGLMSVRQVGRRHADLERDARLGRRGMTKLWQAPT